MNNPSPVATAERQQAGSRSLFWRTVSLPLRLLGVLCGSLLLCVLVEWVGMHLFWPEQGWRHSQAMLHYELNQLSSHFTRSVLLQEPGPTMNRLIKETQETVLNRSGLRAWRASVSRQAGVPDESLAGKIRHYLSLLYRQLESYLIAAGYTVLVFLVRLLVLCLMVPLLLLAAFVGLVDGLVRRDIRRFGAGRESGFVYHRAKAAVVPLLVLPWIVYLAMPVSLNPLLVLLPGAVLLGTAVSIVAGSFKKYL